MESKAYMQWIPQSPPQSFGYIWTLTYQLWLFYYSKQYGKIYVPTDGVLYHVRVTAGWDRRQNYALMRISVPKLSKKVAKVKVKFTLEQNTKVQKGSRGISLLFP
jgi:hypothetical protein